MCMYSMYCFILTYGCAAVCGCMYLTDVFNDCVYTCMHVELQARLRRLLSPLCQSVNVCMSNSVCCFLEKGEHLSGGGVAHVWDHQCVTSKTLPPLYQTIQVAACKGTWYLPQNREPSSF